MRRTRQRVVVAYRAGPTWRSGPPEEQADWDAHAEFVDALVDAGTFVMGGPFSDNSGSLVLFEGVSRADAEALVARDPFVQNGVFLVDSIRDWTVYVDELTPKETV
jgi:uncharacterized protein YciI